MKTNMLTVLEKHIRVKVDRKLLKSILLYIERFTHKNEDHLNFFGGNLLGVYQVKYLNADRMEWLEEILNISDVVGFQMEIKELPTVESNWVVSLDIDNLSKIYIVHKTLTSNDLSIGDKEKLARSVMNMLQYKLFSSMHSHYFKKGANLGVALAVYEKLDRKSSIKRHGTWAKLIEARSEDILGKTSIWHSTIRTLDDDMDIVKMLNDIQGRLKSILNKLNDSFYELKELDAKITATDKFIKLADGDVIKDTIDKSSIILTNMNSVLENKNDLIKEELLTVIEKTVSSTNVPYLRTTLEYMSENHGSEIGEDIRFIVRGILEYTFHIARSSNLSLEHVPAIVMRMRGMIKSSRATDKILLDVREKAGYIIENSLGTSSRGTIARVRVPLLLYLVLRGLIK